jgi:UDP-3-O-[3-hydroxymyristoyl] glucosamine N-acyltransferase
VTRPRTLALVLLPAGADALDRDVAGRPAGRFLLDRLAACTDVDVMVVAESARLPEWCASFDSERWPAGEDVDGLSGRQIVMLDARAWFPAAVLSQLFLKLQHGGDVAVHLAPGPDWSAALRRLRSARPRLDEALAGLQTRSIVLDTTSPDGSETLFIDSVAALADAERQVLRQRAAEALRRGVRLRDPQQIHLRGDLTCGRDVEIDIGVIIQGTVVLGDRVRVGAHSILRDSTVGDDAVIHPFSIVEQSIVGANGFIGPYGRVRPGSAIGDRVQLGNYVEVKNSRIGAGSRINHHSFIGDAELAEQVTIGAGTITCNHDGTTTQKTIIDRGAYIGSGCNLVAPVRIGERATVGAGSTITRDVPAERLTVARARQTTVEHWRGRRPK